MKPVHFFKRVAVILLSSVLVLSACSKNGRVTNIPDDSIPSSDETVSPQITNTEALPTSGASDSDNHENNETPTAKGYKMSVYTEAPNQNSSIKIQYPSFSGKGLEALNTLVFDKVQSFAKIDTTLFSGDTGLNIDYQSAVTLQNSKIISIIFWGSCYTQDSAYPMGNLISLNVDLKTMEEITLKDLYLTDADFEKIFLEKAFFPTDPLTSYDQASFPDMLKLQSPEYQTVDPFSIPDNVSCFLKPEGIVLSMPAVHATGSDHFEAQLKYSGIQQFYLLKQKLWED